MTDQDQPQYPGQPPYPGQPQYGQPQYGQQQYPGQPQFGQPQYPGQPQIPVPPQPLSPADEKLWAVLIHISGAVIWLGPILGYLLLKDRGPFIRWHTAQALNFMISLVIYSVGVSILTLISFGIGAILYLPLGIGAIVLVIMAAVQANAGQFYRYPLTIQFVK